MHNITAARTSVSACLIFRPHTAVDGSTPADAPSRTVGCGRRPGRTGKPGGRTSRRPSAITTPSACRVIRRCRMRLHDGAHRSAERAGFINRSNPRGKRIETRAAAERDRAVLSGSETAGVPRTSHVESAPNAAVLAARDASAGYLSAPTRARRLRTWALQDGRAVRRLGLGPLPRTRGNLINHRTSAHQRRQSHSATGYASTPEIQGGLTRFAATLAKGSHRRESSFTQLMGPWVSG